MIEGGVIGKYRGRSEGRTVVWKVRKGRKGTKEEDYKRKGHANAKVGLQ